MMVVLVMMVMVVHDGGSIDGVHVDGDVLTIIAIMMVMMTRDVAYSDGVPT